LRKHSHLQQFNAGIPLPIQQTASIQFHRIPSSTLLFGPLDLHQPASPEATQLALLPPPARHEPTLIRCGVSAPGGSVRSYRPHAPLRRVPTEGTRYGHACRCRS
jgi:hypothetical protein